MPVIRLRAASLALVPLLALVGCGSDAGPGTAAGTSGDSPCSYPKDQVGASKPVKAPPSTPPADNPAEMRISTSAGDIPISLELELAPCATNSFVSLAEQGYYNDTSCHRLLTAGAFILQCGDPDGSGSGGPGYTYADELVRDDARLEPCEGSGPTEFCTFTAGTIAMANRGPDTNGSQFFLVYEDSKFPPAYTIVGHLDAAGLKVVREVGARGVADEGATEGAPATPVTITSVR